MSHLSYRRRHNRCVLHGESVGVWDRCLSRNRFPVHSVGTTRVGVLRALPADMSSLTASVAGLTSRVEWAAVRSLAVAGDVAQLAACVALHGLSLAVPGEVVWATALVAAGSTAAGTISESATTTKATSAAETTSSDEASAATSGRAGRSSVWGGTIPL